MQVMLSDQDSSSVWFDLKGLGQTFLHDVLPTNSKKLIMVLLIQAMQRHIPLAHTQRTTKHSNKVAFKIEAQQRLVTLITSQEKTQKRLKHAVSSQFHSHTTACSHVC